MAWPNPFRRRDENTRTCWGYTFQLTPDHMTLEQSHPLKFSYDSLAEECLDILNDIWDKQQQSTANNEPSDTAEKPTSPPLDLHSSEKAPRTPWPKSKRDLYILLQDNASAHPTLQRLWNEASTIPPWVDWAQIARGQEIFYRYGGATLTGLAYQSLLGGMGATRVVEVLARTGGFSVRVARHRLFETTQHILECTKSLGSIQPLGAGFASSLRVRLLHASVRRRILALEAARPGYYDTATYGVPINDLDCIATIATFSATSIWLSLPRQGIFLRSQEILDYIALWRLIAHYTGTPTSPFANPATAKATMESLLMNEIAPSPTSRLLATNIICALENQPPAFSSRGFLEASARWLNGNELCDALGLGRPSLYYWALMAGQCLFYCGICYTYRSIPWLDQRKVAALRRVFWQVIVEGKYGLGGEESVFEFKYIPDYHVKTERGGDGTEGEAKRKRVFVKGVERRNLQTLVLALAASGLVGYWGACVVGRMVGTLF